MSALISSHPMGEALAAMSFTLARTLDDGAGLAVAAVNRELRANLIELARMGSYCSPAPTSPSALRTGTSSSACSSATQPWPTPSRPR